MVEMENSQDTNAPLDPGINENRIALIDEYGIALWTASKEGNVDACRTHLDRKLTFKADVVDYFFKGFTPLHNACYGGHEYLAMLLLWHGAHPGAINCMNENCFEAARAAGHFVLACKLEESFAAFCQYQSNSHCDQTLPSSSNSAQQFDWSLTITSVDPSCDSSLCGTTFRLISDLKQLNNKLEISVGRSREQNILINDLSISKSHAKFVFVPHHGYFLQDVNSRYGTYLNNARVTTENLKEPLNVTNCNYVAEKSVIVFGGVTCTVAHTNSASPNSTSSHSGKRNHPQNHQVNTGSCECPFSLKVVSINGVAESEDIGKEFELKVLEKICSIVNSVDRYELTVGRSNHCDIVINDLSVSKVHAKLCCNNLGSLWTCIVVDMKSKHGTFLNDMKLNTNSDNPVASSSSIESNITLEPGEIPDVGKVYLKHRDVISFGRVNCIFIDKGLFIAAVSDKETEEPKSVSENNLDTKSTERAYADAMRKKRVLEDLQLDAELKRLRQQVANQETRAAHKAYMLQNMQLQQQELFRQQQRQQRKESSPQPMEDNAGKAILEKLGWNEGEGIGKQKTRTSIIEVKQRVVNAGLGHPRSFK